MTVTGSGPLAAPRNTKIERVIEAVENLAIQAARATMTHTPSSVADVRDAREEAATALREFMQPTLRVVGGTDR